MNLLKGRNQTLDDSLRAWFLRALVRQETMALESWSPSRVYYELEYIYALKEFCRLSAADPYQFHIFGFDSFEGLPNKKCERDDHVTWHARKFSHPMSEVAKKVAGSGIDLRRGTVRFIKGYFEETLTTALRRTLGRWPPAIVTIDVDYYSSTKTILDWIRPLLSSGTLFYFDDIWAFHGNPNYGELAAIAEFNKSKEGGLTPFPELGRISHAYIYWKREFEFRAS
jgi:hypothetical protein